MPAPSLLTAVAASTPRSAAGPASLDRRRAVRVSSSFSLLEDGLGVSISGNGTPLCNCGSACAERLLPNPIRASVPKRCAVGFGECKPPAGVKAQRASGEAMALSGWCSSSAWAAWNRGSCAVAALRICCTSSAEANDSSESDPWLPAPDVSSGSSSLGAAAPGGVSLPGAAAAAPASVRWRRACCRSAEGEKEKSPAAAASRAAAAQAGEEGAGMRH
mmetsp:Transcript_11890/g.35580  ORF Transcript_11890/g.35580 Transcript_11890/m.35580 type:complete len:218 (+) Transcript_11890:2274-2927(+)